MYHQKARAPPHTGFEAPTSQHWLVCGGDPTRFARHPKAGAVLRVAFSGADARVRLSERARCGLHNYCARPAVLQRMPADVPRERAVPGVLAQRLMLCLAYQHKSPRSQQCLPSRARPGLALKCAGSPLSCLLRRGPGSCSLTDGLREGIGAT